MQDDITAVFAVCRMGERPLTVSFAEPKQSEMAPQTAQDKVLYVGSLPESGTEEMVRDLFSGFGEVRERPCSVAAAVCKRMTGSSSLDTLGQ